METRAPSILNAKIRRERRLDLVPIVPIVSSNESDATRFSLPGTHFLSNSALAYLFFAKCSQGTVHRIQSGREKREFILIRA